MSKNDGKFLSKENAEQDVISMARRLASLYLHFFQVLEEELGEEKARVIIRKVIANYGEESGNDAREKVKNLDQSLDKENFAKGSDLPSLGWKSEVKESPGGKQNAIITYCPFAEYWLEKGAEEVGRLYCFVDQAKYSAYNPALECRHLKNVLDGDPYCELEIEQKKS